MREISKSWRKLPRQVDHSKVETLALARTSAVVKFTAQGYIITEQKLPDADYPQYKVIDHNDPWLGAYTIILV